MPPAGRAISMVSTQLSVIRAYAAALAAAVAHEPVVKPFLRPAVSFLVVGHDFNLLPVVMLLPCNPVPPVSPGPQVRILATLAAKRPEGIAFPDDVGFTNRTTQLAYR